MSNQAPFNAHIVVNVAALTPEDFDLALAEALKQVSKAQAERALKDKKALPGGRAEYSYAVTITQPDLDKPRPAIPPKV
ncbi:hypothetical protein [Pseudomonas baetica]|jgi:hypothetical protein|uniref:hypothetical protein n=1 Tax=Pseudomonas baetica TaxID=674054 RepID=UPI00240569D5|nr:hypothetical protein [Pseudomonas baetica]MDF9779282.1 hypothetical protein [Pseudomonas baetica]